MQLHGGLPALLVERRLSPVSRRERRTVRRTRLQRSRPRVLAGLAAAACVSLAAGVVLVLSSRSGDAPTPAAPTALSGAPARPPSAAALLSGVRGRVLLSRGGAASRVKEDTELLAGDEVALNSEGSAAIAFPGDESRSLLRPRTRVAVVSVSPHKRLRVFRGVLDASIAPQTDGYTYTIETAHARFEIAGTRLLVSARDDVSELDVIEGSVKATRTADGASTHVAARQFLTSGAGEGSAFEAVPFPAGATGTILREYWTDTGASVRVDALTSHRRYPDRPTGRDLLTSLEAPQNWADHYGQRIRGFIHPPAAGEYTFWLASDCNGDLYLSEDDSPLRLHRIAHVTGYCDFRSWDSFASQKSAPVRLHAGRRYYVEVLHKEDIQNDNLSVAWSGPGIERQVISGRYLSPVPVGQ
jgi:hypothetical protein